MWKKYKPASYLEVLSTVLSTEILSKILIDLGFFHEFPFEYIKYEDTQV